MSVRTRRFVYLDSAAMYPVLPEAKVAYQEALSQSCGNPSSSHYFGVRAREALEEARSEIATCLCAKPEEVFFFSNATEVAATVIATCHDQSLHVTASPVEHHAVSENIIEGCWFDVDRPAVCQMLVNNETGEIFSKPVAQKPTEFDPIWICDATAAVGHVPICFSELGCDYLFGDGLKFGGVPGAAFLIAKEESPLVPLIPGGGQERGVRAGTENVPAICAMSAALRYQTDRLEQSQAYFSMLRDTMLSELDDSGVSYIVNSPLDRSAPHILNVSFPGVENTALSLYLSSEGVYVSPGAACSNGLNEPSHVLMSMFGDEDRARSAIRFSFSHETNVKQICDAVEKVAESVRTLRGLSAE